MNEKYRIISIFPEVERAIKYLRLGLAEVQKITPENDFYDPLLLFLSSGLERLFKSMLCLNFKEVHGRLPNPGEIWSHKQGHDLIVLKKKVETICIPLGSQSGNTDYNIINDDKIINDLCFILSEFGKRARYYNLDAFLGIDQQFDAKKNWEKVETSLAIEVYGKQRFYEILADPKQIANIYSVSNKEIVIRLERFFRALTRQFIFGNFSKDAKNLFFQIEDFSNIEDYQFGKTDYGAYKNHERLKRK